VDGQSRFLHDRRRATLAARAGIQNMGNKGHSAFRNLLLQYSQEVDAERRRQIDATLWADYGCEQAVLVFDMSGFSSLSSRYGIVHYLSMVRRMQLTAEPIVRSQQGRIIKFEADNGFATFTSVASALHAAQALNRAFDAANIATPDELDIRIGCGIDHGPILVVNGEDFFGDAVNRASKLGEDFAQPGEILLTRSAATQLPESLTAGLESVDVSTSGIHIEAFRWSKPG
jgi:class 3 adenylate cyclase